MKFSAFVDSGEFKPNVSRSTSAWISLGKALLAVGRPADAVTALTTAHVLNERGVDPIWPEEDFFLHLGDARLHSGDVPGAREAYKTSYELEDFSSIDAEDLRPSRAYPKMELLSTEEGVQHALATPYRPSNPDMDYSHELGFHFASCYWEADAIKVLASFLPSADSTRADVWWSAGIVYIEDKRLDELGEQAMRMCTDWNPEFELAFSELGKLYVRQNQPDRAVTVFEAAMRIGLHDPRYYEHYEFYAVAVGLTQQHEKIADVMKALRARSSTNEALLQALEEVSRGR